MRILVVEDDAIIALSAAAVLEEAGHDVIGPALGVEHALALAREHGPDLALVDINLAGGDEGIDLARQLQRELGVRSLFVSGQIATARSNRDAALGLLKKPYDPAALAGALPAAEAVLQGRTPPPPPVPRALELFA
jgi:CheY-like chemotaxis protein